MIFQGLRKHYKKLQNMCSYVQPWLPEHAVHREQLFRSSAVLKSCKESSVKPKSGTGAGCSGVLFASVGSSKSMSSKLQNITCVQVFSVGTP